MAETLYEALHNTIAEQVSIDESLTPFELIGALEQVKHDLLTAGDIDGDDDELDLADELAA